MADWYAEKLDLKSKKGCVLATEFLIVFEEGDPPVGEGSRFGLALENLEEVRQMAERFGCVVEQGSSFAGFRSQDPEGNYFEVVYQL